MRGAEAGRENRNRLSSSKEKEVTENRSGERRAEMRSSSRNHERSPPGREKTNRRDRDKEKREKAGPTAEGLWAQTLQAEKPEFPSWCSG